MRNIKMTFLAVLLGFGFMSPVFAITEYKLDFKLPKSVKLQLIDNQEDLSGYTRRYKVLSNENEKNFNSINMLMITHGRNVNFTPKEAMEEVLQVHERTECVQKGSKVIELHEGVIIFRTFLAQCSNKKSLDQIYKSFSTPSGQYAINYSAEPDFVSQKIIQDMQRVVKSAKILPNR